MKKLGLVLLVSLLILGGVLVLNPAGDGDSGQLEVFDGGDQPGVQEASVGLSTEEGYGTASEAALASGEVGLTDGSRSSLEMGAQGEIRGRVMDALSEPVADARILLRREADVRQMGARAPVLAKAVSDKQGRFRLAGLELRRFNLQVRAQGWVNHHVSVRLTLAEPIRVGLILRLREGHSVTGTVVDPAGKPMEGAWVIASWPRPWGSQNLWPEVRSDDEGRFSFDGLPRGKAHILAWAEGRSLGMAEGDAAETQAYRVVLPEAGPFKMKFSLAEPSKEGDSKPADVSAMLYLVASNAIIALPSPICRVELAVEGDVSTRGLCKGSFQIHLDSSTVNLKGRWSQKTLSPEKPEATIRVSWTVPVGLEGKLVFKDGKPAGGIMVKATSSSGVDTQTAKSDKDGRFEFSRRFVAGDRMWVYISSPGLLFDLGDRQRSYVRAEAGKQDNVLTVAPTALFSGRVLDARGKPVQGAKVWLHTGESLGQYGKTTSDEKGEFRLSATRPPSKPLLLDASSHGMSCLDPLSVDKDAIRPQEGLVLRLTQGASVEGSVVDDAGVGVPGVSVTATFIPPAKAKSPSIQRNRWRMPAGISHSATTNEAGRFRVLGLAPGSWRVSVKKTGRIKRGVAQIVQVTTGEMRGGLRFVMGSGLSIQGRLITDSGRPLEGAWVYARYDGKSTAANTGSRANTQSSKDGSFVLKGLRPGKFTLTAQLPWRLQNELGLNKRGPDGVAAMRPRSQYKTQVMAGTKDFRWQIALPRFGSLTARIAQGGTPLLRIQLQIRRERQSWSFELPVKQGVISMKRVLTGTYDFTFRSARFADHKIQAQIQADQVTDLGLLSLGSLPEVDCRVLDEAGQGLAGVWIGLDGKLRSLWQGYDLSRGADQFDGRVLTESDANGRFRVPIKGRLRVYAFKPGYAPGVLNYRPPKITDGSKGAATRGKGKGKGNGKGNGKGRGKNPAVAPSKDPVLTLRRAGEISLIAPTATKGKKANWYARMSRFDAPPQPGKKPRPTWSNSIRLASGKSKRFVGLKPGRYKLEVVDMNQGGRFTDKSVSGKSYNEEFVVHTGTRRIIRIP